MKPSRCGSRPDPVTRTSAWSVPATLVTAVVKPWMMPRSSAVDLDPQVDRVVGRRRRRARRVARAGTALVGSVPLRGDRHAGRLLQRRVERRCACRRSRRRRSSDWYLTLEGAVGDLDLPSTAGCVDAAGDRRVGVEPCRRSRGSAAAALSSCAMSTFSRVDLDRPERFVALRAPACRPHRAPGRRSTSRRSLMRQLVPARTGPSPRCRRVAPLDAPASVSASDGRCSSW